VVKRRLDAAILLALLAGCDHGIPAPVGGGLSPPVQAKTNLGPSEEDYAKARAGFKTHLLRQTPSPQEGEPLATPPGAEMIDYRSGGLDLKAFVGPAKEDGDRHPAVLFLHGGFAYGADDWEMSRPYRDAGFIVMTPVLRGENGLGGSFTLYYDEVEDVLAAAEALAKRPSVDPTHIYIAGHSAGGTLALLVPMASDRFRAAASFSGVMDQAPYLEAVPAFLRFDPTDQREFALRSPLNFATSLKCPTRLYAGDQEEWVLGQSEKVAEKARRKGIDVEVRKVTGDHYTSVPPAMRESIEFFRGN